MKLEFINAKSAPRAVGPYAHAVVFGNLIFCSGQIGIDPKTNGLQTHTIEGQTKRTLSNLNDVLKEAGSSLKDIIKTTLYLTNMHDFPRFNKIYEQVLQKHRPARATVGVARLPKGARIEIEAVARLDK